VAWLQVFEGQGLVPERQHPLTALIDERETAEYLASVEAVIAKCVEVMPTHEAYIAQHCKAAAALR
jgi:tryptophan halogenase